MTNLKALALSDVPMKDLSTLANLTRLTWQAVENIEVTEISPLAGLTKLEVLCLIETDIRKLSPLLVMAKLRELDLTGTPVVTSKLLGYDRRCRSARFLDDRSKRLAKRPLLAGGAYLPRGIAGPMWSGRAEVGRVRFLECDNRRRYS